MNFKRMWSLLALVAVVALLVALPAALAAQDAPSPKPPVIPPRTVIVDPYEPNDSPDAATWMNINGLRNGIIDPAGDVDYYAFWGPAGQTILAEIDASEVGSPLDPALTLYDSDGVSQLAYDDNSDPDLDPRLSATLPRDDIYYLKVSAAGGGEGYYWLFLSGADAYEPNNRASQAKRLTINSSVMGTMDPTGDRDWFKFRAEAGQTIEFDIDSRSDGSSMDSILTIYDRDGKTILAVNDDYDSLDSFLSWTAPATGQYYVVVREYNDNGGPEYYYTLHARLNQTWYISPTKAGSIGGVRFAANDIISYDGNTGDWAMHFDASDVGIKANISAFEISGSCLFLSFAESQRLPIGKAMPQDIVVFCADSLGQDTVGTFSWAFDGSDVGLTTSGEAIDAVDLNIFDGSLYLSFNGAVNVTDAGGAVVSGQDEDVLHFLTSNLGEDTIGDWSLAIDGSTFSGMAGEDVGGLSRSGATGEYWLSLKNAFTIEGVSGDANDVIALRPDWSTGNFQWLVVPYWDGSAVGYTSGIDALARPLP